MVRLSRWQRPVLASSSSVVWQWQSSVLGTWHCYRLYRKGSKYTLGALSNPILYRKRLLSGLCTISHRPLLFGCRYKRIVIMIQQIVMITYNIRSIVGCLGKKYVQSAKNILPSKMMLELSTAV